MDFKKFALVGSLIGFMLISALLLIGKIKRAEELAILTFFWVLGTLVYLKTHEKD